MTDDTTRTGARAIRARSMLLAALLCATAPLAAQTSNVFPVPRPDIDPVLRGDVEALLRLADGSYLVGGGFTRLGTRPSPGCGRLLPDGTPDPTFTCATSNVKQYAVDALGRAYALRNGSPQLVRLLGNGAIDSGFAAVSTDASINTMTITAEGVHIAGPFTTVNGTARARVARIGFDGALDATWAPTVDGPVSELAAPGDAFVYLGGSYANVNGAPRTGLARVTRAGGAIDAWNPALSGGDGATVSGIIGDGTHVYVSGAFGTAQGQQRRRLARIGTDAAATLDPTWAPQVLSAPFNGFAPTLLALLDGSLYVGDTLSFTLGDGVITRTNRLFRLSASGTGAIDAAFAPLPSPGPVVSNGPRALVRGEGSGRLVVGGRLDEFTGGALRLGLAALNADGSIDTGSALVEALTPARINAVTVDADGAATMVGNFARIGTAARPGLARLNTGGSLDGAFRPAQAVYTAGRRVGTAVWVADDSTDRIRKLDPANGDAVAGFTPIAYSGSIGRIDVVGNHVYVGGTFTLAPLAGSLRFARIDATTGAVDPGFGIRIDTGTITAAVFDTASSSLFLAGNYTQINAAPAPAPARWDLVANALVPGFAPVLSSTAADLAVDGEGGLYVSGGFTTINSQNCRAPARLLIANGALDPAFNCARTTIGGTRLAYADGAAYMVLISTIRRYRRSTGADDPDWRISDFSGTINALAPRGADLWLAGEYTQVAGVPRNALAGVPLVERFFGNGFE